MEVDGAESGCYGARLWSQAMEPGYGARCHLQHMMLNSKQLWDGHKVVVFGCF